MNDQRNSNDGQFESVVSSAARLGALYKGVARLSWLIALASAALVFALISHWYVGLPIKLKGENPRSASMLVEDYIRPAAVRAGVIRVENGITYDRDGEIVKRFGFHVLGRHSIATFLMENETNPAVVQAVMRHSKMDMTLHYSHTHRAAKRAERERVLRRLIPAEMREPDTIQ